MFSSRPPFARLRHFIPRCLGRKSPAVNSLRVATACYGFLPRSYQPSHRRRRQRAFRASPIGDKSGIPPSLLPGTSENSTSENAYSRHFGEEGKKVRGYAQTSERAGLLGNSLDICGYTKRAGTDN